MKTESLVKALTVALQNNLNVLVKGSPGIGKSDIIAACADSLKFDLMICHPVVEDPTDAKGLPAVVNGVADFLPYGNLRLMIEAKKPLIVFLDDLGQASPAVQASYMQLLLARQINGHKISKHVRFVAATNSRKDNAGVNGLLTPLLSRFALIAELEPDVDGWKRWAIKNGVPIELVAFINLRPGMLVAEKATREIENFHCPRTITALGKWVALGVDDLGVWEGCVGKAFAVEFMAFYRTFRDLGNLPEQIILNPDKARIPDNPSSLYAVCGAVAHKATPGNFDAILIYGKRLADEAGKKEFETVLVKDSVMRNEKLCETHAFVKWSVENPNVVR